MVEGCHGVLARLYGGILVDAEPILNPLSAGEVPPGPMDIGIAGVGAPQVINTYFPIDVKGASAVDER